MANLKATNFEDLARILPASGNRKTIGNNTTAEFDSDDANVINIRLHEHLIVRLYSTGAVYISDAGWPTVTTRERINQFLPARYYLCQRKGQQYIGDRQNDHALTPFDGSQLFASSEASTGYSYAIALVDDGGPFSLYESEEEETFLTIKAAIEDAKSVFPEVEGAEIIQVFRSPGGSYDDLVAGWSPSEGLSVWSEQVSA